MRRNCSQGRHEPSATEPCCQLMGEVRAGPVIMSECLASKSGAGYRASLIGSGSVRASARSSRIKADPDHASDQKRTAKHCTGEIDVMAGTVWQAPAHAENRRSHSATCPITANNVQLSSAPILLGLAL